MLNEQCVMLTIIIDVEMVLISHITWLESDIYTTKIHPFMSLKYMYEYRNLVWMILLTLYLSLERKCVIVSEFYH